MATLNIKNNFTIEIDGIPYTGKQGDAADGVDDEYGITIVGDAKIVPFTLVGAAFKTVWDEDSDYPADYSYLFIWADGDIWIQLIGQAANVSFKQLAKVPFAMSYGQMLAAANTTPISAAPSVTDVDSVVVGNVSATVSVRGLIGVFN